MCRASGLRPSVHLVVTTQVDEETHVIVPAEQNSQIVVDRERPVVGEVALELVGPDEGIARIGSEPAERRAEQFVLGRPELAGTSTEAR